MKDLASSTAVEHVSFALPRGTFHALATSEGAVAKLSGDAVAESGGLPVALRGDALSGEGAVALRGDAVAESGGLPVALRGDARSGEGAVALRGDAVAESGGLPVALRGEGAVALRGDAVAESGGLPVALRGDARSGEGLMGSGRPLLYLHGFPDHPPTASTFFAELANRGHRVLAPWLRGYAPSVTHGPFDLGTLIDDVLAIAERWSPGTRFDLVGHDWGAMIAYALCSAAPERLRRVVTLAVPHPLTFLRQLRMPAQLSASWYMALFQLPGSERIAAARDFRLIDRLWRRWSPGFQLAREQREDLHACLENSRLASLNYYREILRAPRAGARRFRAPIATPVLALHGANDGCILPPTIDDRRRFTGPYEREVLPDLGHFLHLEAPSTIATRVSAWLGDD